MGWRIGQENGIGGEALGACLQGEAALARNLPEARPYALGSSSLPWRSCVHRGVSRM